MSVLESVYALLSACGDQPPAPSPSNTVTKLALLARTTPGLPSPFRSPLVIARGLVIVRSVVPGGAADRAGVAVGDIITAVDGKPIQYAYQASRYIDDRSAGDVVRLSLERGDKQLALSVTLEAAPN
ncbi:hypothetical protein BH11MYX1_BH11MYX1_07820 [soil metagenome]